MPWSKSNLTDNDLLNLIKLSPKKFFNQRRKRLGDRVHADIVACPDSGVYMGIGRSGYRNLKVHVYGKKHRSACLVKHKGDREIRNNLMVKYGS